MAKHPSAYWRYLHGSELKAQFLSIYQYLETKIVWENMKQIANSRYYYQLSDKSAKNNFMFVSNTLMFGRAL